MFPARLILLASTVAIASIAGHTAAGDSVSALGFGLTVVLAAALANPIARKKPRLLTIAGFALGTQLLLHLVMGVTAHSHGQLLPDASMLLGHLAAAMVIAVIAVEADRIVDAFIRLISPRCFTLPALVAPAHGSFAFVSASPRAAFQFAAQPRGPPQHS